MDITVIQKKLLYFVCNGGHCYIWLNDDVHNIHEHEHKHVDVYVLYVSMKRNMNMYLNI
jgi:hypothetical protein